MPHATTMPFTGFQAIILCGPGVSLNTFTANPEDYPKALVPIANRPMVWYPMDWCYRMGITNIHLITPPTSLSALSAALSQNPHLTSLPSPKADILAPADLTHTTPTASILRLPEVRAAITGDLIILPCDLICELPGEALLESWMVQQSPLDAGASSHAPSANPSSWSKPSAPGSSGRGRKGGLAVYYETRGAGHVKGAETDFIITTSLPSPPAPSPETSLRPHISTLLYATTTDTLNDITAAQKGLPLRHGLIRKHGRIRMLTTHRDAHIYLFPHWVMDWVAQNERFDSISEDVVGWWAKAGWQDGLAQKLHLGAQGVRSNADALREGFEDGGAANRTGGGAGRSAWKGGVEIDLASMSSTHTSELAKADGDKTETETTAPPKMLAYIHPTPANDPNATPPKPSSLIRRVDTPSLLLSTSLHIASLSPPLPSSSFSSSSPSASSPLAHASSISPSATIAPHTTIHESSTLIGPNTEVAKHCTIKACSIGSNCVIEAGAKLTGCLLMDGAVIKEKAVLQGCILGRRSEVGKGAHLEDCQVPEQYAVPGGREAKGEIFSVGLEDDGEGGDDDDEEGEVA